MILAKKRNWGNMDGMLKGGDKSCKYFENDRNREVDDKR